MKPVMDTVSTPTQDFFDTDPWVWWSRFVRVTCVRSMIVLWGSSNLGDFPASHVWLPEDRCFTFPYISSTYLNYTSPICPIAPINSDHELKNLVLIAHHRCMLSPFLLADIQKVSTARLLFLWTHKTYHNISAAQSSPQGPRAREHLIGV